MTSDIRTLVDAHLDVWNSGDAGQRLTSMAKVYADDVRTTESDASYAGHAGVNEAIAGLHGALPGMTLTLNGPIQQAQDLVTYQWSLGTPTEGIVAATGRDVLLVQNGLITALYVVIDA
ncbi:nuclear transport factor 2 family protein [Microbacterium sp. 3J1]|uniref:nuclear transport factor 2 family protein n=1 Tax=Microbacterium sp. 3J1 TaxID=861269 RepID=UPI000A74F665|nr:nuclear transport factor 2 family protein [Microbacterium sp. 3J1]